MNSAEFHGMLLALAAAWQRRDYPTAVSFFAEDVKYADPSRYEFANRADLQAFFENDEGLEQQSVWHHILFDEARQLGVAEYTYDGSWRYHGTVWIRVQDGVITHWREYQHTDPREWEDFVSGTAF
jgi:hypothetical protein